MKKLLFLVSLLALLSGCQTMRVSAADNYLQLFQDYPPKQEKFQVCHDMGCEKLASVSMGPDRWNELSSL